MSEINQQENITSNNEPQNNTPEIKENKNDLEYEIDEIREKNNELENEIENIREENYELENANENLTEQNKELNKQIDDIKEKNNEDLDNKVYMGIKREKGLLDIIKLLKQFKYKIIFDGNGRINKM